MRIEIKKIGSWERIEHSCPFGHAGDTDTV